MKFEFTVGYSEIIDLIERYFKDWNVPVKIEKHAYKVNFIIKKFFSTSILTFAIQNIVGGGVLFILSNQEIGWTHKSKIGDIKEGIKEMVTDLGGKVVST